MFIRKRLTHSETTVRPRRSASGVSYQLLKTYRDGGKVRQRVVANLGEDATIGDALARARRHLAETLAHIERVKDGTRYGGYRHPPRSSSVMRDLNKGYWQADKRRRRVAQLETVVSEMFTKGVISDTTPSAKFLEECARDDATIAELRALHGRSVVSENIHRVHR